MAGGGIRGGQVVGATDRRGEREVADRAGLDHLDELNAWLTVAFDGGHGVLYPIAACVPETPQYGLLALLQAANAGDAS